MKKSKTAKITAILLAVALASVVTVYAAYDSTKDPLVSLSYLTDIFKPAVEKDVKDDLNAAIEQKVNSLSENVKADAEKAVNEAVKGIEDKVYERVASEYGESVDALQKQVDTLTNGYTAVTLEPGKKLVADADCEIVITDGNGTVRCSDPENGIIDCTDGIILYEGQEIPVNHKLLIPENGDGRGINAVTKVTLLVKGGYEIA